MKVVSLFVLTLDTYRMHLRFTSVSWAYSTEPDKIHQISNWPSSDIRLSFLSQVPTQYDTATGKWGYLLSGTYLPETRFKQSFLSDPGSLEAFKGYFSALLMFTMVQIHTFRPTDDICLKIALSVPSDWPTSARHNLRKAAQEVKFPNVDTTSLLLVEEMEAAMLAAFPGEINESYNIEVLPSQ